MQLFFVIWTKGKLRLYYKHCQEIHSNRFFLCMMPWTRFLNLRECFYFYFFKNLVVGHKAVLYSAPLFNKKTLSKLKLQLIFWCLPLLQLTEIIHSSGTGYPVECVMSGNRVGLCV